MNINTTRIKLMMGERDMTQVDLAAQTGISRQSISTILCRGTAAPKNVYRLAAGLGVPVADIIMKEV